LGGWGIGVRAKTCKNLVVRIYSRELFDPPLRMVLEVIGGYRLIEGERTKWSPVFPPL
jgi:hypothetical protein